MARTIPNSVPESSEGLLTRNLLYLAAAAGIAVAAMSVVVAARARK
jgi:hypothetical protein